MPWRTALARLGEERGAAFDPQVVDLAAAAIEAAPPDDARRDVLLVRGGELPWRAEPVTRTRAATDDDDDVAAVADDALELIDGNEAVQR
jgi:hypothetical protein